MRDTGEWEPWVIYMLEAVAETSATTVEIVTGIRQQMADVKHRLREDLPKIYSQELLNNLFRHPYTRIEYLQNDLDVSRQTAAKYLDTLAEQGFVEKHRSGKHNYFINVALVKLFLDVSADRKLDTGRSAPWAVVPTSASAQTSRAAERSESRKARIGALLRLRALGTNRGPYAHGSTSAIT